MSLSNFTKMLHAGWLNATRWWLNVLVHRFASQIGFLDLFIDFGFTLFETYLSKRFLPVTTPF